jgi:hypothetical protein
MAFQLYSNKSSINKKNSRMAQGGVASVGERFIRWWERDVLVRDDVTDTEYAIDLVYAGKPDLIAFDFYGRNDLGWLVLQYNNIVDVNEELAVGKVIFLPTKDRVFYEMLTRAVSS